MDIEKFKNVCFRVVCVELKFFNNAEKRLGVGEGDDIVGLGLCEGDGTPEFGI